MKANPLKTDVKKKKILLLSSEPSVIKNIDTLEENYEIMHVPNLALIQSTSAPASADVVLIHLDSFDHDFLENIDVHLMVLPATAVYITLVDASGATEYINYLRQIFPFRTLPSSSAGRQLLSNIKAAFKQADQNKKQAYSQGQAASNGPSNSPGSDTDSTAPANDPASAKIAEKHQFTPLHFGAAAAMIGIAVAVMFHLQGSPEKNTLPQVAQNSQLFKNNAAKSAADDTVAAVLGEATSSTGNTSSRGASNRNPALSGTSTTDQPNELLSNNSTITTSDSDARAGLDAEQIISKLNGGDERELIMDFNANRDPSRIDAEVSSEALDEGGTFSAITAENSPDESVSDGRLNPESNNGSSSNRKNNSSNVAALSRSTRESNRNVSTNSTSSDKPSSEVSNIAATTRNSSSKKTSNAITVSSQNGIPVVKLSPIRPVRSSTAAPPAIATASTASNSTPNRSSSSTAPPTRTASINNSKFTTAAPVKKKVIKKAKQLTKEDMELFEKYYILAFTRLTQDKVIFPNQDSAKHYMQLSAAIDPKSKKIVEISNLILSRLASDVESLVVKQKMKEANLLFSELQSSVNFHHDLLNAKMNRKSERKLKSLISKIDTEYSQSKSRKDMNFIKQTLPTLYALICEKCTKS